MIVDNADYSLGWEDGFRAALRRFIVKSKRPDCDPEMVFMVRLPDGNVKYARSLTYALDILEEYTKPRYKTNRDITEF